MRQLRRSRQGGEGGRHKLRFLERHVRFLKGETRNPACGGSGVASRVTIGEDDAECERVAETEPAHCPRRGDCVERAAAFDGSLELVPKGALRGHERMFAQKPQSLLVVAGASGPFVDDAEAATA